MLETHLFQLHSQIELNDLDNLILLNYNAARANPLPIFTILISDQRPGEISFSECVQPRNQKNGPIKFLLVASNTTLFPK